MNKSMWLDNTDIKTYPFVQNDYDLDIVIIGGNLAGLACAYRLLKEGYKVAILESNMVFGDENLNTFGNITYQFQLIYDHYLKKYGLEKTKLLIESMEIGIKQIVRVIDDLHIECHYDEITHYFYSKAAKQMEAEFKAAQQLNMDVFIKNEMLGFKNQGQFNLSKYLVKLLWYFERQDDLYLFEQARIQDIQKIDDHQIIYLKNGYKIQCNHLIVTKDYANFESLYHIQNKLHATKHHVVAIDTINEPDTGIYTYIDHHISFRKQRYANRNLLLITKEDHQVKNEEIIYRDLREFGEKRFGLSQQIYKWSYDQFHTNDQLPLIGKVDRNIYIATGFNQLGLVYSHASAEIIKDLIMKQKSPYQELYDPNR